jgi:hypothetical protein
MKVFPEPKRKEPFWVTKMGELSQKIPMEDRHAIMVREAVKNCMVFGYGAVCLKIEEYSQLLSEAEADRLKLGRDLQGEFDPNGFTKVLAAHHRITELSERLKDLDLFRNLAHHIIWETQDQTIQPTFPFAWLLREWCEGELDENFWFKDVFSPDFSFLKSPILKKAGFWKKLIRLQTYDEWYQIRHGEMSRWYFAVDMGNRKGLIRDDLKNEVVKILNHIEAETKTSFEIFEPYMRDVLTEMNSRLCFK